MRVSPFISGIATGAVAGAVVSMVAAGAMMNPSVRPPAAAFSYRARQQAPLDKRARLPYNGYILKRE